MVKNQIKTNLQKGHSDIRLWPCYMVISGAIFYLSPRIGVFWSALIVVVPFIWLVKWFADKQPDERYDVAAWSRDLDNAIARKLPIPELQNYKVIEYKTPKQNSKSTKKRFAPRFAVAS